MSFVMLFTLGLVLIGSGVGVQASQTTLVSVDSVGTQGNEGSGGPSLSADGRLVTFASDATNLVPGDTNGAKDIFVRALDTGELVRVSVDSAGTQGDDSSFSPVISADGRSVTFASTATNLVPEDTNGIRDTFVHDLTTGQTVRVSVNSAGTQGNDSSFSPSLSADGQLVAFASDASNLVAGDTNGAEDIFVHNLTTGQTARVSVDSAGIQGNGASFFPVISADGRSVTFASSATNLVPGDTNGTKDIFVHDLTTGQTVRVSVDSAGTQGNGASFFPVISADGQLVAFESLATNLVPGDTNGGRDIFVRDLTTGQTVRVSVDSASTQGNGASFSPSLSADGQMVAFSSDATNLVPGDTNGVRDIFVRDLTTRQTVRVSVDSAGIEGNGDSFSPSLSANERLVAFDSFATNLVPGDTNGAEDIFVHDFK